MPECELNCFNVGCWNPAFGNQTLLSDVQVEVVESVIDGLDLSNLDKPDLDVLGGRDEHAMPVVIGLPKNRVEIFKTLHYANGHLSTISSLFKICQVNYITFKFQIKFMILHMKNMKHE